jgi:glutathione reductase (NADPH)
VEEFDVDFFVIGGGSGGVRAARIAASHGASVALAEENRVGGTCVIRGCVPKKLMVYAGRFSDYFEEAVGFGWQVGERRFDWPTFRRHKDREIGRLEEAYRANLERAGVRLIESRAVLEGKNSVRILKTGEQLRARYILVAVGSRAESLSIPGAEHALTSDDVFSFEQLPKRILIVGGGYIAVEFAGIFHSLGSRVTLVHRGDKLLRGFDDEIRGLLAGAYSKRGICVRLSETIAEIERVDQELCVVFSDGSTSRFDQVLFATGRLPNTDGLGLENADILLDTKKAVPVDKFSRSTAPTVFAVGDVTNRSNLTPVAIREGHAVADTIFGGDPRTVDHDMIPTAVFSVPEIGVLGRTEAEARATCKPMLIFKTDFRPMNAAFCGSAERMFMKIVVDQETDRVMGVHIVGSSAAEIIQSIAVAVTMGATKADFDRTMAVHPTASEELLTMREPHLC